MHELVHFGSIVLIVAGGFYLALLSTKLTRTVPIPAPALFLLGAAVASDLYHPLGERVTIRSVERIGVIALVLILFDGGMHVGVRRARRAWTPIASLGILGTFATAALMALPARYVFGFDWTTAALIGAAVAPTDPAVMFSVLGNREVGGRSGTILEGESGANDPVGIALMVGLLAYATGDNATPWTAVREFFVEMGVGAAVGVVGGFALRDLMQRPLPREGLYPLRTLAAAGVVYGAASTAHGSGFLAVFLAGLLVGDTRAPYKAEIERFHTSLATLAEITVFVALGVTIELASLGHDHLWLDGVVLALILVLARPLACALLLLPVRLRRGEKLFVMWGGLKGAVPILLAALTILAGAKDARDIYAIVFVVVAFSVVVQGATIPLAAATLGVPMRVREPEPWDISIRVREEPEGVQRFVVGRRSRAAGHPIADLPITDRTWISMVVRAGEPLQPRGSTQLRAGDEVLVLAERGDADALRDLFEGA